MNFFESLSRGVRGLLQGRILKVTTRRYQDKEYVQATVGIPDLFINFDVNIPEKFIPDCLEGMEIQLLPTLRIGKFNKPELILSVENIVEPEDIV